MHLNYGNKLTVSNRQILHLLLLTGSLFVFPKKLVFLFGFSPTSKLDGTDCFILTLFYVCNI